MTAEQPPQPPVLTAQRVTVTDVDMPFGSMVVFMVKWAIAAIPALLILVVLGGVVSALFAGAALGIGSTARRDNEAAERATRIEAYRRDVARWHDDCDQYANRSVVASVEQRAFESCQTRHATLTHLAGELGTSAP